jgi:ABC-type sugar transport system ATPase subunit
VDISFKRCEIHAVKNGVTVFYISHRIDEISNITDRVSVLKDGNLRGTHRVSDITHDLLTGSMVNGKRASGHLPSNHISLASAQNNKPSADLQLHCARW